MRKRTCYNSTCKILIDELRATLSVDEGGLFAWNLFRKGGQQTGIRALLMWTKMIHRGGIK